MFSAGVAAAGIVLFLWYNYRLETIKRDLLSEAKEFDSKVKAQSEAFNKLVKESKAEIEKAAGGAASRTNEIQELLAKVGPSIAHIEGKGPDGAATSGSGFVVTAQANESWILTNFHLVAGTIAEKGRAKIQLRSGETQATVYSWDQPSDLALIIVRIGNLPALTDWAKTDLGIGTKVWAVGSAPGEFGAAASQGFLLDNSENGLLTDADVPTNASGGPLIDPSGKVMGVLSIAYAPAGYSASKGWAVPIRHTCKRVLRCPENA